MRNSFSTSGSRVVDTASRVIGDKSPRLDTQRILRHDFPCDATQTTSSVATQPDVAFQRQLEQLNLRFRPGVFQAILVSQPRHWPVIWEPEARVAASIPSTKSAVPGLSSSPSSSNSESTHRGPIGTRPYSSLWWPSGTFTVSAKLQVSVRQNCRC